MTDNKQLAFDSSRFIQDMEMSVRLIPQAVETGDTLAASKVRRLLLVGCGAPYYMFQALAYWANQKTADIKVRVLYPHEFIQLAGDLDSKSAVIFGSHSGKTAETVSAAESISNKVTRSIAITQHP